MQRQEVECHKSGALSQLFAAECQKGVLENGGIHKVRRWFERSSVMMLPFLLRRPLLWWRGRGLGVDGVFDSAAVSWASVNVDVGQISLLRGRSSAALLILSAKGCCCALYLLTLYHESRGRSPL